MQKHPFFAAILVTLRKYPMIRECMMATDGVRLWYNEEAILKENAKTILWALCHEVCHVILKHPIRANNFLVQIIGSAKYGPRIKEKNIGYRRLDFILNLACDLAISHLLISVPGRPEWSIWPKKPGPSPLGFDFESLPVGKDCEFYFKELLEQELKHDDNDHEQPGAVEVDTEETEEGEEAEEERGTQAPPSTGDDDGSGQEAEERDEPEEETQSSSGEGTSGVSDGADLADFEKMFVDLIPCVEQEDPLESQIDAAVINARNYAAGLGKMPEHLDRLIEATLSPGPLPWRVDLQQFVSNTARGKRTYRRLNRRHQGSSIIVPSREKTGLRKIVFGSDQSSSMDDSKVGLCYQQMETIVRTFLQCAFIFMPFDTDVVTRITLTESHFPLRDEYRKRLGHGGTLFRPFIREAILEKPDAVIVLTDLGLCDSYPEDPHVPFFWVSTTPMELIHELSMMPPFGKVRCI